MISAYPVTTACTSEAVRDRPGVQARLLPTPFPDTVSLSHPISGDGRSIDYTRHTSINGHSRVCAPPGAHSSPATGQGLRPDIIGPPEAIAPRLDSPVVSLGTPLSHDDGMEDTPDPLRTVESVWGSHPTLDPPSSPSEKPIHSETAEGPRSHPSEWSSASRILTGSKGVSPIALSPCGSGAGWPTSPSALVTALPSPTLLYPTVPSFFTLIPAPDRQSIPTSSVIPEESGRRCASSGIHPSERSTHNPATPPIPSPCRGDRRVTLPPPGRREKLFLTPSGIIQSNQLRIQSTFNRVQSTINQSSINPNRRAPPRNILWYPPPLATKYPPFVIQYFWSRFCNHH